MIHYMNLSEKTFALMKEGKKVVEVRLYDEKRRKLQIGDIIEFNKSPKMEEKMIVKVTGIQVFDNFEDLFMAIPQEQMGFNGISVEEFLEIAYDIYSKENEAKFGVVGIRVKLEGINIDSL